MTDADLIEECARVWVDGGGDADGIAWCYQRLHKAVSDECERMAKAESESNED